jgi:type I restriction enzyme S subunit
VAGSPTAAPELVRGAIQAGGTVTTVTHELGGTSLRRFKSYPAYKDSGIEWLGKIPTHWAIQRIKSVASVQLSNVDKKSIEGQEHVRLCNYVDVYYNEHITGDLDFMAATATPEQVRRFSLHAGDVLVTKDSESWTDIAVPAVVETDLQDVLCGYHLALVRPRPNCVGAFLARAFSAVGPRDQFQIAANGITRFGLGGDAIRAGLFAVPPTQEQLTIAGFLDRETARIDWLVAKKERLIELLQEKRAALITRAVTKGLDPSVPMKDSGVEWLGQIPARWEVKRIRHVVRRIEQGWSPDCENREASEDEWGVLKAGCVNRGRFVESEHKALPAGLDPIPELEISPGDLLMSRASGSRELVGSVAFVSRCRPRLLLCDKLFRLHVHAERGDRRFLAFTMNSRLARWQIEIVLSGGSGLANNIAQEVVKDLIVVLPPLDEQASIIVSLDRATARIDALMSKAREAVDRLRELRTALISAAVTGKIDVRAV